MLPRGLIHARIPRQRRLERGNHDLVAVDELDPLPARFPRGQPVGDLQRHIPRHHARLISRCRLRAPAIARRRLTPTITRCRCASDVVQQRLPVGDHERLLEPVARRVDHQIDPRPRPLIGRCGPLQHRRGQRVLPRHRHRRVLPCADLRHRGRLRARALDLPGQHHPVGHRGRRDRAVLLLHQRGVVLLPRPLTILEPHRRRVLRRRYRAVRVHPRRRGIRPLRSDFHPLTRRTRLHHRRREIHRLWRHRRRHLRRGLHRRILTPRLIRRQPRDHQRRSTHSRNTHQDTAVPPAEHRDLQRRNSYPLAAPTLLHPSDAGD